MKNLYKTFSLIILLIFILQPIILYSQSNQYLHFDKEDDFVILNEAGQYIDGANELTMTGWFYCDELSYGQGYMGFRAGAGNGEFYLIQLNNGEMECRLKSTVGNDPWTFLAPANTIIPQIWQHWAWVYNGSELILYVNGALIGSIPASGTFSSSTVSFAIGKSILTTFNFYFGGRADEVSVWDKALDQDDIQDIMENELTGNEENLQLYYKFDQGDPGGDNTGITHLFCEIGSGERDAELMNFALTGETSNFNGELNPGYQAISFPEIPNHLTTDEPFDIGATATSGLDVLFEVLSGPAAIDGNTVTLTGDAGEVSIEATQPGDGQYEPAVPVTNTFMVVGPMDNIPDIDLRCPLQGDVYVPTLSPIQFAAISTIEYPGLFNVQSVQFEIDGETISATKYNNDHFDGWWTPPEHGTYSLTVRSTNNYGASTTETVDINIIEETSDMDVLAVDGVWLDPTTPFAIVDAELPSYLGAFDTITATLEVQCPPGGCGAWDRIAHVYATDHTGQRIEIIRYITPYEVPCSHNIDLTDYMSFLQGKISFEVACSTFDNGYEYYLTLNYKAGTPVYPYSNVDTIWYDTYQFGDYANLQPVPAVNVLFPENIASSKLKLVSSGHGWWGDTYDLNTDNAAEFYEATHTIWIDDVQTFEQHNWYDCNPNPDGCQPQDGTWQGDRAGWCPGAIAQWFEYDITPYIESGNIEMDYVFFPDYMDYCHPNHPDCITGVTCSNCEDGFNPHLVVRANIVSFSEMPIIGATEDHSNNFYTRLSPNPTNGQVQLSFFGSAAYDLKTIEIYSITGSQFDKINSRAQTTFLDMSGYPRGLYLFKIQINGNIEIQKLIVQ